MEGKLKHWNEDKGFGFISSTEAQDIFIHISALKKMSRRPTVGDIITFQIHTDNNGKKRATNAQIHGVASVNSKTKVNKKTLKSKHGFNWLILSIFLIILIAIGYGVYQRYFNPKIQAIVNNESFTPIKRVEPTIKSNFSCSGKEYCSQMTSCKEAKYYLKNCPETKMDGNNDGVPCESQWCN